ncbi:oligoendopeptidase F [Haloimpatiens massiliensis]|uniref:oligoendopeptidase F n=1 Tax=Haloimpatiens massiliensis TaxID=1658110 RepID=UPI000C8274B3|nr:oligoendopeptidase F [Haloimpatiens massiliensis]
MANVKKLKSREKISEKYKWNIKKIYGDLEAWEKDFNVLKEKAPQLSKYSGKLSEGKELLNFLGLQEEVSRLLEKLYVYAHLRSDEDTGNNTFQGIKNRIDAYLAEVMSFEAFFQPEILSLEEGNISKSMKEVPELNMYKFYLEDILKMKPHTLDRKTEEILASLSDCLNAPGNIRGMLANADMSFPYIKDEEGNDVELSEGNFINFLRSKNREVRKEAFEKLYENYYKYRNTFATALTSSIKNFIVTSKTRNFESSLESSLKPNNIPLEVYNNAVETINKHLDSLHRYVRIKKKLLGIEEMHMYDLYVPVIDTPKAHIEFEKGVQIVKEGLKPLGKEYLDIFQSGVEDGWIDVFQNKGKRSGAYSWGCYDTMPYVLLNYNYGLDDVSTLAHEMGHSIHSYYSRKNQPFVYSDYVLFCAEVASITNECLLIKDLIDKEKDEKRRLYLINQQLEGIRTTVFRQIMFAEFEKITHEILEEGKPLTSEELCKIWKELNAKYFGEDMIIDEGIEMEWARIPHFYSDFYVYQYATGYAAANSFSTAILNEGEEAVEKYKGFLKSGGSDYPINILKRAGVDMTTAKPLEDTIKRFDELLDMLDK